jgi:hypothetical protein
MRLLKLAIEKQRWDLAAHIIVLTTAKLLGQGDRPHAGESREKKRGCPKRKSER